MKSKILWLAVTVAALAFPACSKNNHLSGTSASLPVSSDSDPQDQLNVITLVNTLSTSASIVQAEMSPKAPTRTSGSANTRIVTGYPFNGAQLGKPEDLFCGAGIGGAEDADNYYVNVTYNGPDCAGLLFLKGTVIISVQKAIDWTNVALGYGYFYINLNHLSVTRLIDSKHVSLTGTILVYNEGNYYTYDTNHVASLQTIVQRKNPNLYMWQQINSYIGDDPITIHYDDNSATTAAMSWWRTYRWKDQVVIDQYGFQGGYPLDPWSFSGTDHHGRPYHWRNPVPLVQYQDCHYKITTGQLSLIYDDANPGHDSASVFFGVDANGTPASPAIRQGQGCLDKYFLHAMSFSGGHKTFDLIFPE